MCFIFLQNRSFLSLTRFFVFVHLWNLSRSQGCRQLTRVWRCADESCGLITVGSRTTDRDDVMWSSLLLLMILLQLSTSATSSLPRQQTSDDTRLSPQHRTGDTFTQPDCRQRKCRTWTINRHRRWMDGRMVRVLRHVIAETSEKESDQQLTMKHSLCCFYLRWVNFCPFSA